MMRGRVVTGALVAMLVPAVPASASVQSYIATVGFQYVPGDPTVVRGNQLTLVTLDSAAHDVTSTDTGTNGLPLFQSAIVSGAGARAVVNGVASLDPGIYPFFCSVHDAMRGTITIS